MDIAEAVVAKRALKLISWPEMAAGAVSAALGADVTCTTSNTWVEGPSVTLAAGTWLVHARAQCQCNNVLGAVRWYARLTDGTTHHASAQSDGTAVLGSSVPLALAALVTLGAETTLKLQVAVSAGAATCLLKAALSANGSGNNATTVQALRLG